jgi:hypothetical protein
MEPDYLIETTLDWRQTEYKYVCTVTWKSGSGVLLMNERFSTEREASAGASRVIASHRESRAFGVKKEIWSSC